MDEQESGRVECYAGHRYAQEPRAFFWRGRRREVLRIAAQWRTPDGPAFRAEAGPGELFDLHYHEGVDRWAIRPVTPDPAGTPGNQGQGGPD